MKRFICILCAFILCLSNAVFAEEPSLDINAKSSILIEQSTMEVLYENNADEQLPIASITKIMTMILITEAIDSGAISMQDMVPVSERAMSMGGSTMFLEAGEELSVYEMLKGIAVASANDGCVAMAEFLSGSVEEFVNQMNKKAQELGMTNTHFVNTNGLDAPEHYSSARDVAIMSAELLKHEEIFEFTTIWTDKMHDGKFDLANTNKLIRFYPGANGLKTGSTSQALCCLAGSAERDGMQLIAVVLGAPTSNDRFSGARTLLDYGFASYAVDKPVSQGDEMAKIPVKKGKSDSVEAICKEDFSYLLPKSKKGMCEMSLTLNEELKAPVNEGDVVGKATFTLDGAVIGEVDITAAQTVEKKGFIRFLGDMFSKLF